MPSTRFPRKARRSPSPKLSLLNPEDLKDRWINIASAALLEIAGRGGKDILVSVLDCVRDLLESAKSEVGKVLLKSLLED
jgi:hypothetical protein